MINLLRYLWELRSNREEKKPARSTCPLPSTGLSTAPCWAHTGLADAHHTTAPTRKWRLRGSHGRRWLKRAGDSRPGFQAQQGVKKESGRCICPVPRPGSNLGEASTCLHDSSTLGCVCMYPLLVSSKAMTYVCLCILACKHVPVLSWVQVYVYARLFVYHACVCMDAFVHFSCACLYVYLAVLMWVNVACVWLYKCMHMWNACVWICLCARTFMHVSACVCAHLHMCVPINLRSAVWPL